MTKDDIIKAAFKVWGRELYRTTSLSQIALELGVSKTALYRHFKDKDALFDAMYTAFFEDCAGFIKSGYDRAVNADSTRESFRIWIRTISEYYVRNKDAFIFSLIWTYNNRDRAGISEEFRKRGIDFLHPAFREKQVRYPSGLQLAVATLVYSIAHFHRKNHELAEIPETEVERMLTEIEALVSGGLGLEAKNVAALDFEALEQRASRAPIEETENNVLLRAVAEAVAEAGPWETSMEMVARRSGLSKSGLYAHFKSKKDMLTQLFIAEFTRISNFAKIHIETSEVPGEQLYLAIISIIDYLRSRPEILVALDWVKTGRLDLELELDLEKEIFDRMYRIIGEIKLEAVQNLDRHFLVWAAQWILFMIVNTLALWPAQGGKDRASNWAKYTIEIPNESFRTLFRFIALGLEAIDQ